jgi:hypothetical protein
MTDEELVKHLRDLGDRAAFEPHMHHTAADRIDSLRRDIQELQRQVNYWRGSSRHWQALYDKAANRLEQVDPEFDKRDFVSTTKDLQRVSGDTAWNPWEDV